MLAEGPFEVKLAPLAAYGSGAGIGRMSIDKVFSGALAASSVGEMLTAMSATKGSAGYVAVEMVTGVLDGRRGSFVLQHDATMTRGAPYLHIVVVPDSGTGALVGLSGVMEIINGADGSHAYRFDYVLPEGSGLGAE